VEEPHPPKIPPKTGNFDSVKDEFASLLQRQRHESELSASAVRHSVDKQPALSNRAGRAN
jgi:hypothetical protein